MFRYYAGGLIVNGRICHSRFDFLRFGLAAEDATFLRQMECLSFAGRKHNRIGDGQRIGDRDHQFIGCAGALQAARDLGGMHAEASCQVLAIQACCDELSVYRQRPPLVLGAPYGHGPRTPRLSRNPGVRFSRWHEANGIKSFHCSQRKAS
jgi:hypothetical protein